jgi:hypothetical protein
LRKAHLALLCTNASRFWPDAAPSQPRNTVAGCTPPLCPPHRAWPRTWTSSATRWRRSRSSRGSCTPPSRVGGARGCGVYRPGRGQRPRDGRASKRLPYPSCPSAIPSCFSASAMPHAGSDASPSRRPATRSTTHPPTHTHTRTRTHGRPTGLEKDIAGLKREIRERDDAIGDKERRIYDLKKKNQAGPRGMREGAAGGGGTGWGGGRARGQGWVVGAERRGAGPERAAGLLAARARG